MITLGWVFVFGLPTAVFVAALVWPERIPKDRTVKADPRADRTRGRRNYRLKPYAPRKH